MKCMKKSHYKNLSNYEILKMNFINKKKIFDGKNIQVFNYKFEKNEKEIQHEIIEQGGISCVLAIDEDEVIMVKQFRYPFDQVLEIPAGNIEKSETSEECARRELLEETGYSTTQLTHLIRFYPSLGYNLQFVDCYLATKLEKKSKQKLDDDEFVSVHKIPIKELFSLIKSGKIIDPKTLCALSMMLQKNDLKFKT